MEKIEKKLRKANFSTVEKTQEGYKVSKSYNSMSVGASVDNEGIILGLESGPSALIMLLMLITFPIGTVVLVIYYLTRVDNRRKELRTQVENALMA
jgi:hypothetical protein